VTRGPARRAIPPRLRESLAEPTSALLAGALLLAVLAVIALVIGVLHRLGVPTVPGSIGLGLVVSLLVVALFVRLPKVGLLVLALVMLFGNTVDMYSGYSARLLDDVAVPLIFGLTLWRTKPWQSGRLNPVREVAALAVLGLAAVSSVVNGVPPFVWLSGLLLMAKVIGFFYIVAWHDFTRADLRQYMLVVAAIATPVIALGFVEALNPEWFRDALRLGDEGIGARGGVAVVKSIFFHPVLYGWLAALMGLYLFAGYAVYRRWWLLAGALLFSVGVFLSARRRAIVGLVVALAAGLAAQLGRSSRGALVRGWLPIGAGMLALALLFAPGLARLVQLTEERYVNPVLAPDAEEASVEQARVLLYLHSVDVATEHFPLGAGVGRYGSRMSAVEYSPLYYRFGFDDVPGLSPTDTRFVTDTFWPAILGEVGVFGVLAYLVFIGAVGLDVWRASRTFHEPLLWAFCLGTLMVFAHGLAETLASSMYHSPPRIYLLFGATGVAVSLWYAHHGRLRPGAESAGSTIIGNP
jgi:hypothetical protein